MQSNLYHSVQPPIAVNFEIERNPPRQLEISTRGLIFPSDQELELGTTLHLSLHQVSMTGSLEFMVKVFGCSAIKSQSVYEIRANFYGVSHEKEMEILDFIGME
jgi:hypothetical protein